MKREQYQLKSKTVFRLEFKQQSALAGAVQCDRKTATTNLRQNKICKTETISTELSKTTEHLDPDFFQCNPTIVENCVHANRKLGGV